MSEIIGNKLKKILKRKGINAKEFGEMIGKSEQRVYQYYNATKFDSDQIIEFSNIFKVPITYWFDDDCQLNQSIVNGDGSAGWFMSDIISISRIINLNLHRYGSGGFECQVPLLPGS